MTLNYLPILRIQLLLCLLAASSLLQAQSLGEPNILYQRSNPDPHDLAAADMDGDGDLDIVCPAQFNISWFENDGSGQGWTQHLISNAYGDLGDVEAGDIDEDGDMDLVVGGQVLLFFANQGDGQFDEAMVIDGGQFQTQRLALGDLDGDSDLEIVTGNVGTSDDKLIYYNYVEGSFSEWQDIRDYDIVGVLDIDLADMDNDGDLDVAYLMDGWTLSDVNRVAWCENNGDGTFDDLNHHVVNSDDNITDISTGDLNGDGLAELILSVTYSGLRLLTANGEIGSYDASWLVETSIYGQTRIEDLDSDGDLDLVACNRGFDFIGIFENTGAGLSSAVAELPAYLTNDRQGLCLADLSGNGWSDILFTAVNDRVGWFAHASSLDFSAQKVVAFDGITSGLNRQLDIDNDGDLDLLIKPVGDHLLYLKNNDGSYEMKSYGITSSQVLLTSQAITMDVDQDADMDIICGNLSDSTLWVFPNDGNGKMETPYLLIDQAIHARALAPGDLNNDGLTDLVVGGNDGVSHLRNSGDGSLEFVEHLTEYLIWWDPVSIADLENDGDPDILFSRYWGAFSSCLMPWLINDGEGNFPDQTCINTSEGEAGVPIVSDLNQDGFVDVVVQNGTLPLYVYLNDGASHFSGVQVIDPVDAFIFKHQISDWNQDGFPDLLYSVQTESDDYIIYLALNDGEGTFLSPQVLLSGEYASFYFDIVQMDDDGDPDLFVRTWNDELLVFANTLGEGCTSSEACNYDAEAFIDDGSCCFGLCGCTNTYAANFNPEATCDDESCEFIIEGTVFNDLDVNALFEDPDYGLAFQTVTIESLGLTALTDNDGHFSFTVPAGSFMVELVESPVFLLNTTPSFYTVETGAYSLDPLLFGIGHDSPDFGMTSEIYSNGETFLCSDWFFYTTCFRNTGNEVMHGVVEFTFDELFQDFEEITPIDSVYGNTLYMSFENLEPGEMFCYEVSLLTPTVSFIGEHIFADATVRGYFGEELVALSNAEFSQEVACAYDPNDKQAFPPGETEEHFILNDTPLEFLVRFQNTGNAPAVNIHILDTIDSSLDLSTFEIIANSHSMQTTIDEESRQIDFFFPEIMLPDSVNDEPNSHGLVSYRIQPLTDLEAGSVLENTAYIYFDNNDPIVTNTTWHTIYSCGEEAGISYELLPTCEGFSLQAEASHFWVSEFDWTIDGEPLSSQSEFIHLLPQTGVYTLTLDAGNALCEANNSLVIELPEWSPPPTCLGDFNCDGLRGTQDLLMLLSGFGCTLNCEFDLDLDGVTSVSDILELISVLGTSCGG